MKTIEHLIIPRFEVIADYPDALLEVGHIFEGLRIYALESTKVDATDYPHLFKPLQWWEKRTEEEMPMYLKIDNRKLKLSGDNFDYYKIIKWHMNTLFGQIDPDRMSGCSPLSFNPEYTYQPCSEEEYLTNKK